MPSSITNVSGVFINVLIFFAQVVIVIGNSRNLRINKPLHEKIGRFWYNRKIFGLIISFSENGHCFSK